jgi:hypothetical protein
MIAVMRACEGCRRRKIKCDAATTNTWPCSACVRLKLHCIPPTVQYDPNNGQGFGPEKGEYESGSGDDDYANHHVSIQQHLSGPQKAPSHIFQQEISYADGVNMYQPLQYGQPPPTQIPMQFANMPNQAGVINDHFTADNMYPVAPLVPHHHSESPEAYSQDQYSPQDLADLLGDLKMDTGGSGMSGLYLFEQAELIIILQPRTLAGRRRSTRPRMQSSMNLMPIQMHYRLLSQVQI